jgi:hypothetical protein
LQLIANNKTKEDKKLPCILCGERFTDNKSKLRHWRLFRCKKLKIAKDVMQYLREDDVEPHGDHAPVIAPSVH